MTKKKLVKKGIKKFTGFYKPNAKLTTAKALFDNQLIGTNPEGRALNSGY